MEEAGKVAIGRFVMRNKQYTAAIRANDGRLMMSTLAYADEVVLPESIDELVGLDDVDVSPSEIKMAEALVESLSDEFAPEKYHDDYREQVLGLIEKKAAGEEFEVPEVAAEKPKIVDLMAALEASVKPPRRPASGTRPRRRPRPRPRPRSRPDGLTCPWPKRTAVTVEPSTATSWSCPTSRRCSTRRGSPRARSSTTTPASPRSPCRTCGRGP